MSILLVRAGGTIGDVIARRLVAQGDEVRVVERFPEVVDAWREIGVFVAQGPDDDADLIERAAQNVRTIVVVDDEAGPARDVVDAIVEGARAAGTGRVVYCARRPDAAVVEALRTSSLEYVVMTIRGKGLFAKQVPAEVVAEAVDAADDLAGAPHLEVDLADPAGRVALGLHP